MEDVTMITNILFELSMTLTNNEFKKLVNMKFRY